MTSLNPLFTVGDQLAETMRHHLKVGAAEARAKALDLLRAVEIPEPERRLRQFPHQLSGGQRQRVVIAAALSCDPDLLVADEPTTALDVSVQATILDLIRDLATRRRLGVLLITHNMGVVAQIADRVTIMRHGEVVEQGPSRQVLGAPRAPYARALIGAVPRLDRQLRRFPVTDAQDQREAAAQARLAGRIGHQGDGELLSVADVSVVYGGGVFSRSAGFRAVEDVSFSVRRGEIFGIVGESGSGKSTLASAIAGLVPTAAGRIAFAGHPLGTKAPATCAPGDPDDLPGPLFLAELADAGRRGDPRADRILPHRRRGGGRHPDRGGGPAARDRAPLSPCLLRRSAAAHLDRPRAGLAPAAPDLRRADLARSTSRSRRGC